MDEQKELQTNSTPPHIPPTNTPIPVGIPHDALIGVEIDSSHAEIQKPVEITPDIEIPTLRTYKGDINQTVNKDKISTAKILIAEQNQKRATEETTADTSIKRPTNIIVLVLSIILVVGALGGIGYFGYKKIIVQTIEPVKIATSFLFVFDQEKTIEISENTVNPVEEIQKQTNALMSTNNETYTDIVFYKKNQETKESARLTSQEFFKLFDISLPTNIGRSISNNFVYGMYKTNGKVEPFLVLGISDYETLYSGMFIWESTIALDIRDLFPTLRDLFDLTRNRRAPEVTFVPPPVSSTTTSTSTLVSTSTSATTTIERTPEQQDQSNSDQTSQINRTIRFIDIVFSNKDARAVRDPNGNPFFYYSFIDKTKILFAQDPKVLNEISRKIKEKSLVR